MSHTFEVMEGHAAKLGTEASQELAEFALEYIQRTEQQLKTLLLSKDSTSTKKYAHKVLGAVRLYGTPKLESLLCQVRDNDYTLEMTSHLQQELFTEFTLIDKALRAWLVQSDNSSQS